MKRLKNIILNDKKPMNTTFTPIYDGPMTLPGGTGRDNDSLSEPTYFSGEVAYTYSHSGRGLNDVPTVTISIPTKLLGIEPTSVAAADACHRRFIPYIDKLNDDNYNRTRPVKENGRYYVCRPGGEVLRRNCAYFGTMLPRTYDYGPGTIVRMRESAESAEHMPCLCLMIKIQLPEKRIPKTATMLCRDLPQAVQVFIDEFDSAEILEADRLSEKQAQIRQKLEQSEYCAFVADGSVLPRSKGTDMPMTGAVPFVSPPECRITLCGVAGMGVKRGVTVITGGGYSGKTTLLDAISAGVWDHIAGDGRELVITDQSAVKISAEDGRAVKAVNVSPFIRWLPGGGDSRVFSTDRASGSTSQAANIAEAIDTGCRLLLIDEDKSATNFMIRDKLMKRLIVHEPITPFTDRANELWESVGVSTILVIGGSGEYLAVADRVYMMDEFILSDVTQEVRAVCAEVGMTVDRAPAAKWDMSERFLRAEGFSPYPEGSGTELLNASDTGFIMIGNEKIDCRAIAQIVSYDQLNFIGFALRYMMIHNNNENINISELISDMMAEIQREGINEVFSTFFAAPERWLALPRASELAAVINRMRRTDVQTEEVND